MAKVNRGKYEKQLLSEKVQRQRDELPKGIGLALSPLFDFHKEPYLIYNHLIRYFHVGFSLWENLLKHHAPPCALNFLDVGCGFGEMKTFIQRYRRPAGYTTSYIGVDGDPLRIQRCTAQFPRGDFRLGFLPDVLDTVGTGFAGIVCSEVFEHLTHDEGAQVLQKLYNLTVFEGVAIFTVPSPDCSKYRPPDEVHQNEIKPEDFIRTAEEAGWTVTNWFWLRPNSGALKTRYTNVNRLMVLPIMAPALPVEQGGQDALYVLVKKYSKEQ